MIDFTKPLTTRDGRPVTIITTDGHGNYPVVGYIGEGHLPYIWRADGRYVDENVIHCLDIVDISENRPHQYAFYALSTISSDISPRRCSNAIAAKSESAIGKALKIKFENDLPVSVEIV